MATTSLPLVAMAACPFWDAGAMTDASFRRLSMADLDENALRRLVAEGEPLFVERKQQEPKDGFGPVTASFANTLGGWLLVGVAADGGLKGYDPGPGDFTDKIRHKLSRQVDPLPPFAADLREIDDVRIGVIRVFESADTPHIVIGDGSVPIREPGGLRRIQSHAELLELAKRGEQARRGARERLHTLPYALNEIEPAESESTSLDLTPNPRQFVVRLAPLTRPEDFADRLLAIQFGREAREVSRDLLDVPAPPDPSYRKSEGEFDQRGFKFTTTQAAIGERTSVIADAGGVLATRIEFAHTEYTTFEVSERRAGRSATFWFGALRGSISLISAREAGRYPATRLRSA
jgi:Putative DNA-binding domain